VAVLVARFETHIFSSMFLVANLASFVNGNKLEKILSLKGFRPAGTFGAWLSLTPNDDPLVLRDVGPPEIYALSWEAP
jgi:hypothetical protein